MSAIIAYEYCTIWLQLFDMLGEILELCSCTAALPQAGSPRPKIELALLRLEHILTPEAATADSKKREPVFGAVALWN